MSESQITVERSAPAPRPVRLPSFCRFFLTDGGVGFFLSLNDGELKCQIEQRESLLQKCHSALVHPPAWRLPLLASVFTLSAAVTVLDFVRTRYRAVLMAHREMTPLTRDGDRSVSEDGRIHLTGRPSPPVSRTPLTGRLSTTRLLSSTPRWASTVCPR